MVTKLCNPILSRIVGFYLKESEMDLKIITKDLLLEAFLQNETEEERIKIDKTGINLLDIKILRLDFQNIFKIDHIWMMTTLQKLVLTYNHIEKMENLETLVNLRHLDLSFNKITVIKNVNQLYNLEVLLLNHNRIGNINNMDNLQKLEILSLSGNLIENYEEIAYLRKFKLLKVFSFDENPCSEDILCMKFVMAVLPTLKYLNYKLIHEKEKKESEQMFSYLLMKFDEQNEEENNLKEIQRKIDEEMNFNTKIFIGNLNTKEKSAIDDMFLSDSNVVNYQNDNNKNIFNKYYKDYKTVIGKFSCFALDQYNLREEEINSFLRAFSQIQNTSSENSRQKVKIYIDDKTSLIESEKSHLTGTTVELLQDNIDKLWANLMTLESELYEQCEEMFLLFDKNINALVADMIMETQNVFSNWRQMEETWHDDLKNLKEFTEETAENELKTFHENHCYLIDSKELGMLTNIKQWLKDTTGSIHKKELQRHRNRVNEITHFIEYEKQQLKNHVIQCKLDETDDEN